MIVAALWLLATACGGDGRAGGTGAAEPKAEAKAESETAAPERTRPAQATAEGDGDGGAVARTEVGAVARADGAEARAGGKAPERGTAGGDRSEEDRSEEDRSQKDQRGGLVLEVGGDPGTRFSGVCSVGGKEKTIAGTVPERHAFEPGDAGLECEINKKDGGAPEVVVEGDGVRSVQRTDGGTVRFALLGGDLSSATSSVSLSQAVASSGRSSMDDPR